ncbi:MAG: hypothetical protein EBR82_07320 [Caulobacteraceae bacterium]|nr:hypothetical protein [Caulobacteraceae bacterium]
MVVNRRAFLTALTGFAVAKPVMQQERIATNLTFANPGDALSSNRLYAGASITWIVEPDDV